MKRSILSALVLSGLIANAQDSERYGRVGINTTEPNASLEIRRHEGINAKNPQGFLLPNLTQEQRNAFTKAKLQVGLQIFNTDKNCIDWWNGSTWQCTDGTMKDDHGANPKFRIEKLYWEANDITIYKNNCPSGQQATANAKAVISHSIPNPNPAIEGKGIGLGYTQAEAEDKALAAAKVDFYRQVQEYVNGLYSNSTHCEAAPMAPPTRYIQILDPNLQIGNTKYWYSSIKDSDYLRSNGEVIMPTDNASWADQDPIGDGIDESVKLDVQGVISKTTPIDIAIPITTPPSGTITLPAFTTYLEIPAEYTEDGRAGIVEFAWETTSLTTSTKYFKARIFALYADINLKKLDIAKGMGADQMGLPLGKFMYPINSSDNDQSTWKGELELRLISGIPDKRFAQVTTIGTENYRHHQFFYVPVMAVDGRMWLGNNLGADYANINKGNIFNPGQQAKNATDKNAYGSLGQWGRAFDGHELMDWVANKPLYTNSQIIWNGYNVRPMFAENCPDGWKTPTYDEYDKLKSAVYKSVGVPQTEQYIGATMRMPYAGYRNSSDGRYYTDTSSNCHVVLSDPYYHVNMWRMINRCMNTGGNSSEYTVTAVGTATRCTKD